MDKDQIVRFVESVALGEMADRLFEAACRRAGLPPWHGCVAPTDYLVTPAPTVRGRWAVQ